jgi:inner membrane protein
MTLAAEAPDLDVLGYVRGPVFGFAHHRGITHSFIGIPFVAAALVGVVYLLYRLACWRGKQFFKAPRWGLLFFYAWLAGLSHILLDFTTNYGVRPLTPFYGRWYSWDIVFIIEPVLLLVLFAGLALPALLRLVSEEVGDRRPGPRGRWGAGLALLGMLAVWGVRDFEHRRALATLQSRLYQGAEPIRVSAYPYWINPFKWAGVVETRDFFMNMNVDSLTPDVDPDNRAQIRYKPEETPVTIAAKKSRLGRVYLNWAVYPFTETERLESPRTGYIVRFADLRFLYPDRKSRPLSSAVLLDDHLNVIAERMGTRSQPANGGGARDAK